MRMRMLLSFILLTCCSNNDTPVGDDSGLTSHDSATIGDSLSDDAFIHHDSEVTDDSKTNETRLDIGDVIKYLFEADPKENSLSVFFEPREGYVGDNFYLSCYDADKNETLVQAASAGHLETSISNRYLFNIPNLKEGTTYTCGLAYQNSVILYQGNDLYIRARLKTRDFPIRYVLFADAHNCDSLDKFIPFLENEVDGSDGLISIGDTLVSDGLTDVSEYEEMWYGFFNKLRGLLYKNPFYPVLGNHDIGNTTNPASIGHEAFLDVFELPQTDGIEHTYYSINGYRHTMIVLDSNSLTIDESQLDLIARATNDSADKHSILLLHHQIQGVENSPTQGGAAILQPAPKEFHEFIQSRGIHLVINGHRHFYHVYKKDEVYYITMPTICEYNTLSNSTRIFDDNNGKTIMYNDNIYGYGVLEIYEDRMRFTLKGYDGAKSDMTEMETIEIIK